MLPKKQPPVKITTDTSNTNTRKDTLAEHKKYIPERRLLTIPQKLHCRARIGLGNVSVEYEC